jgi:hypothetical protein
MLALLLAVALTAAPRHDTLITRDGTRLVGTVVEESPTKGVAVELPDGTLRHFDPGAVVRIEFADGSVSTWESPKPDAARAVVLAQQPTNEAPQQGPTPEGPLDTVFLVGGGRVRGRVMEFIPKEGVTIQMPDGSVRRYATDQIDRIQYADGTISRRRTSPPPAYAPPSYGPPRYAPPPYPPPPLVPAKPAGMPAITPFWASFSVGGAGFGGDLAGGVHTSDILTGQLDLLAEAGIRLAPSIGLAGYLDVGTGDPAAGVRTACRAVGTDCTAQTIRIGGLLRHTWDPNGRNSPWIAVGAGYAETRVNYNPLGSSHSTDFLKYTGWEPFRFMAGVDLRSNPYLGFGLYAGAAWATFNHYQEVGVGSYHIADQRLHVMFEGGIRLTLFP